jgi:ribose transport system substrate-binding protein
MKKGLIHLFAAALFVSLCAAGASAQTKQLRVGISSPESQNPFYVQMTNSAVATFKARGIEPILLSANADVNEQISNINDLVAAKVDAILISPLDTEGPAAALQRAKQANIPIFMMARTLDLKFGPIQKSFIGIHFDEIGRSKGEWLAAHSKPGKVAMLLGPAGALVMVEQEKSFREAISKAGYQVVFAQNSTQTRENGLKLAEDALIAHPDLVAVYAANDDIALGAAQAVKAAEKSGSIAVIGLNGAPPALAAIHKGEMAATVLLDPVGWGKTAANTVADYLLDNKEPAPFVTFQYRMVDKTDAFDAIPEPLRARLGVSR